MKHIKRVLASILIAAALISLLCTAVFAKDVSSEVINILDDGSYFVITISEDNPVAARAVSSTFSKTGSKTYSYYSGSDELLWVLRVHGTFTYDGSSAEATDADYSYEVYSSDWSFVSGSASYSGATATASGRFKHGLFPTNATVSLTCSPSGKLS